MVILLALAPVAAFGANSVVMRHEKRVVEFSWQEANSGRELILFCLSKMAHPKHVVVIAWKRVLLIE